MPMRSNRDMEKLLSSRKKGSRGGQWSTTVKSNFDPESLNLTIKQLMDGAKVDIGIHDNPEKAEHAYYNEYGTARIPARPAWRTTLDRFQKKYDGLMLEAIDNAITGKVHIIAGLQILGSAVVEDLKKAITAWKKPPNAPSTIAKKGFNDPLIETGETRDSISVIITAGKTK